MECISLTSLEDKFALRERNLKSSRPALYPSEASVVYHQDGMKQVDGKCMRAAWYRASKVPKSEPATPRLQSIGDLGKWAEIGLVNRWKEMGIWVDNNIKFYRTDLAISGELDVVIKLDSLLWGVEVKSFYGYNAQKEVLGTKRPLVPGRPKANQLLQSLVYEWEYKDKLDAYRMFYIERGNGIRAEFQIGSSEKPGPDGTHGCWYKQIPGDYWNTFDEDIVQLPYSIEDIHGRYKELLDHLKAKTLPPKDFTDVFSPEKVEKLWKIGKVAKTNYEKWCKNPSKNPIGNWECSYCQYRTQCKSDQITAATEGAG